MRCYHNYIKGELFNMTNKNLFNQKEFPVWKGYNITNEKIKIVKDLWLNDIDLMAKNYL